MGDKEYGTVGNNVISREPQYQICSPRHCRERKRGNSCRSVRFLNESKQDKRLKNNFEQNTRIPEKARHSIENARNHPLWQKFVPTFTLNPRLLNYWDGQVKKGDEFDSISSMTVNASKTVKGKIIRCDKNVFGRLFDR